MVDLLGFSARLLTGSSEFLAAVWRWAEGILRGSASQPQLGEMRGPNRFSPILKHGDESRIADAHLCFAGFALLSLSSVAVPFSNNDPSEIHSLSTHSFSRRRCEQDVERNGQQYNSRPNCGRVKPTLVSCLSEDVSHSHPQLQQSLIVAPTF